MKNFADYMKEELKNEIEKKIEANEALLTAWKQVERKRKKDGSDFQRIEQNFANCNFYAARYSLRTGTKELTVNAFTKKSGYISECIETSELAKYTKLENIDPARIIEEPYIEKYFFLTPDEIETKIEEKKKYHETRIEELKKTLKRQEADNKRIEKLLNTIAEELEKTAPDNASYYKEKLIRHYY